MCYHHNDLHFLLQDYSPEQVHGAFHWSFRCNVSLWSSKAINIIGIQIFILFLCIGCAISITLKPYSRVVNYKVLFEFPSVK